MITSLIRLILSNPTVSFLIMGFIASAVSWFFKKQPQNRAAIIELLSAYFFLFSIGLGYIDNFIMHVFFSDFTAKFIGWENSPFQLEVGFVSLGIGIAGLIAFKQGLAFRTATLIPPASFLWGAAGGHIYQIMTTHNMAAGNAGSILWTDIILPVIGFTLLYLQWKTEKEQRSNNRA